MRGLGDRWLAGEPVQGVGYAQHARVAVTGGRHDGATAAVLLLLAVGDDPLFLLALDGGGEARVRQSALRATDG